jgi:hypothetical protein
MKEGLAYTIEYSIVYLPSGINAEEVGEKKREKRREERRREEEKREKRREEKREDSTAKARFESSAVASWGSPIMGFHTRIFVVSYCLKKMMNIGKCS